IASVNTATAKMNTTAPTVTFGHAMAMTPMAMPSRPRHRSDVADERNMVGSSLVALAVVNPQLVAAIWSASARAMTAYSAWSRVYSARSLAPSSAVFPAPTSRSRTSLRLMLARTESSRSAIASRCSRRSISASPAIAPHLDVPLPDETTRRPAGPKPWLADVGLARQVRALSGGQHDLARNVLGGLGHEGLPRVRERVDRADLRAQLALVDEAGNGAELGTARVPYEMNDADVVPIGLRRSHDGHQGTTGLDDGWGMSEHVAAACVVDQIPGTDRRLPTVPFEGAAILRAALG